MNKDITVKPLSGETVRERRRVFMDECKERSLIRKGDKRIRGNRFCSVCGTRLAVVPLTGSTEAVRNHYVCYFSEIFTAYVCEDSRRCQARHKQLRERSEN